jgi:hypothetical protein
MRGRYDSRVSLSSCRDLILIELTRAPTVLSRNGNNSVRREGSPRLRREGWR